MQGLLALVICLASVLAKTLQATTNTISPDCESHCGDLMVPYPFGIIGKGKNCSLNPLFDITCNNSFSPPKAFLRDGNIQVRNILDTQLEIENFIAWKCYNNSGNLTDNSTASIDLTDSPYTFSESNKFTVIGCNDFAVFLGDSVATGCLSVCSNTTDVVSGKCSGIGCCETSIPKGLKYFETEPDSFTDEGAFDYCSYAFLAEENTFTFNGASDFTRDDIFFNRIMANVTVVLDWAIGNLSCSQAQKDNSLVCQSNSECVNSSTDSNGGYRCKCKEGYEGNPYLHPGCQDIDECQDSNKNQCFKNSCHNTPGSYKCSCPQGYVDNGSNNGSCVCAPGYTLDDRGNGTCLRYTQFPVLKYSLGIAICVLVLVIGGIWLYSIIKQRKLVKRREKLFKQNGGEFLKEKLATKWNSIESVNIFPVEELGKATNKFAENTIVGQGGYGTVYKGILPDKRIVAIKKSKVLDGSQKEQFINEVIILTQVNHRNVVKLLGCCLEDEVPLLVYEFVSNNTLFHHIHSQPGGMPWLSWDNRLRIATESAGALAYLHSAASMPIIHRDFKSPNILLDENYTTKIADFGASRLVPLDHSQVTTLVQGTLGYLDPEYFHTSQLTDKSDVYSFGVVLVELLTSQKAVDGNRAPEERSLATHFVVSMKQNSLFEILDPRVRREGTFEQLQAVAELGKRCLSLYGEDRPTMKEVAMELEGLRKLNKHPWAESHHERGR